MKFNYSKFFNFTENAIVYTGGTSVMRCKIARSLYDCARNIAILDQNMINSGFLAEELNEKRIVRRAWAIFCNVLGGYHLYRDSKRTFSFTSQTENWVRQICRDGVGAIMPKMFQATSQTSTKVA